MYLSQNIWNWTFIKCFVPSKLLQQWLITNCYNVIYNIVLVCQMYEMKKWEKRLIRDKSPILSNWIMSATAMLCQANKQFPALHSCVT